MEPVSALKVTAIIPAYNAEQFIDDALNSIFNQSHPVSEIIVVNDGSIDSTPAILAEWQKKSSLLRVISQPNGGLSAARNAAIVNAQSRLIALLDADDIWDSDHLANLVRIFDSEPDVIAAFSDRSTFDTGGTLESGLTRDRVLKISGAFRNGYHVLRDGLFLSLVRGNYIAPSSLVLDTKATVACGLFDENIRTIEDRDFLFRLSRSGAFAFVDKPTTRCRIHLNAITAPANAASNTFNAMRVLRKTLDTRDKLKLTHQELEALQQQLTFTARQYFYLQSTSGLRSYRSAIRSAKMLTPVSKLVTIRDVVRATVKSLR